AVVTRVRAGDHAYGGKPPADVDIQPVAVRGQRLAELLQLGVVDAHGRISFASEILCRSTRAVIRDQLASSRTTAEVPEPRSPATMIIRSSGEYPSCSSHRPTSRLAIPASLS